MPRRTQTPWSVVSSAGPTEPLRHDPWLAPLRDNPRFAEILQRAQARRDEALAVFRDEGGEGLLGLRSAA